MHCPYCANTETIVKDSRNLDDGDAVRRRRYCMSCDSKFTTFERVQFKEIIILKNSGDSEFFDRSKLVASIDAAVRKRNISPDVVDSLAKGVFSQLQTLNENHVESKKIGELVMEALKKLDKVAYVRFASVYQNFEHTEDFKELIKQIS
jgi:transcriptional repressor NrdR